MIEPSESSKQSIVSLHDLSTYALIITLSATRTSSDGSKILFLKVVTVGFMNDKQMISQVRWNRAASTVHQIPFCLQSLPTPTQILHAHLKFRGE